VLALKNRVALEFFTVLNMLFTFMEFLYFYVHGNPGIFHSIEIYFIIQDF